MCLPPLELSPGEAPTGRGRGVGGVSTFWGGGQQVSLPSATPACVRAGGGRLVLPAWALLPPAPAALPAGIPGFHNGEAVESLPCPAGCSGQGRSLPYPV